MYVCDVMLLCDSRLRAWSGKEIGADNALSTEPFRLVVVRRLDYVHAYASLQSEIDAMARAYICAATESIGDDWRSRDAVVVKQFPLSHV